MIVQVVCGRCRTFCRMRKTSISFPGGRGSARGLVQTRHGTLDVSAYRGAVPLEHTIQALQSLVAACSPREDGQFSLRLRTQTAGRPTSSASALDTLGDLPLESGTEWLSQAKSRSRRRFMFLLPFTSPSHATGSTASAWAWLGDDDFALHLQELSLSVSQLKPDCQRFFVGASAKSCSRSAVTPLPHGYAFHTATRSVPRHPCTAATSLCPPQNRCHHKRRSHFQPSHMKDHRNR